MPKYHVHATIVAGKYLGVFEADTPEEAEEIALNSDAASISFCHQCANEAENATIEECAVELAEDEA